MSEESGEYKVVSAVPGEGKSSQVKSEEHPRYWLAKGGGGFEGGLEGLKAATFSGEGLVDMLCQYRLYLRELGVESQLSESAEKRKDFAHLHLMTRLKLCLHKWAAKYAGTSHAKEHVKQTVLLEQEIDEWILRQ
jgi:hypothetical protein